MKRSTTLVAAFLSAIALTGCATSASTDSGKIPDTSAPSATPTPTPGVDSEFGAKEFNDHGNLVKQIGQLSGLSLTDLDDTVSARFVVTKIELDPACDTEFELAPANGHYLAIHLNVETTPELAQADFPSVSFNQYGWQAYGASGTRLNDPIGNSYSCLDTAQLLPSDIGPGQSVSGIVLLDVSDTTGSIALTFGATTGWEWTYPR